MHVHVTCKYSVYPSKMIDGEIKGNKRHFIRNQRKNNHYGKKSNAL